MKTTHQPPHLAQDRPKQSGPYKCHIKSECLHKVQNKKRHKLRTIKKCKLSARAQAEKQTETLSSLCWLGETIKLRQNDL